MMSYLNNFLLDRYKLKYFSIFIKKKPIAMDRLYEILASIKD